MKLKDYRGYIIETMLCGMPCYIGYRWERGYSATATDPGEPDGPEDITVFNRKGYEIDWLMRKAIDAGVDIARMCHEHHEGSR